MTKPLLFALTVALAAGCVTETDTPVVEEPVVGEAEAVTEVEEGPADDTLIVDEDLIDPTYVPEEDVVEGDLIEGEMLVPEGE